MNQLMWIYLPDVSEDDVFLLNYRSATSNKVRHYPDRTTRPRTVTSQELGGRSGRDLLRVPWKQRVDTGVDVDRRPDWWYNQSRSALREAKRAMRDRETEA